MINDIVRAAKHSNASRDTPGDVECHIGTSEERNVLLVIRYGAGVCVRASAREWLCPGTDGGAFYAKTYVNVLLSFASFLIFSLGSPAAARAELNPAPGPTSIRRIKCSHEPSDFAAHSRCRATETLLIARTGYSLGVR